jgi:hypothetical protein
MAATAAITRWISGISQQIGSLTFIPVRYAMAIAFAGGGLAPVGLFADDLGAETP